MSKHVDWWNNFQNCTEDLNIPAVFPAVLSREEVRYYQDCSYSILNKLAVSAANELRIWKDGKQHPQASFSFIEKICSGFKAGHDTLETEMGSDFCMILNHAEQYIKELNIKIEEWLHPILQQKGYPVKGIDITLIAGNYQFTPLGIHVDHVGENVFHLHLGPAKKNDVFMV